MIPEISSRAMKQPPSFGDRIRRLFHATPPGTRQSFADGLLAEGLEPRVLYSAAPLNLPVEPASAPAMDSIQFASQTSAPSLFAAGLLPVTEIATFRGGIVTVNPSSSSDPELGGTLAHETAHLRESQVENPLLRSLFETLPG